MIEILRSHERGSTTIDWLNSKHSFSFGDYYDSRRMGFGVLRVINEDVIEGSRGFELHPHRDMEIISYVVDGLLSHKDSMGNAAVIRPGEIQRMSAGSGVRHSEHNGVVDRPSHFLQIWILPEVKGIAPSYQQVDFSDKLKTNQLVLVASPDGRDGSVALNQHVFLYALKSIVFGSHQLELAQGRKAWIQVIRGELTFSEHTLKAGDAAAISEREQLSFSWSKDSEFLLFDLP